MPLHRIAIRIVQAHPDVAKRHNSAKRIGDAREQASQISAAGDGTRERDNRLVNLSGRCLHSPDHSYFCLLLCGGNADAKDLADCFQTLTRSSGVSSASAEVICRYEPALSQLSEGPRPETPRMADSVISTAPGSRPRQRP